MPRNTNGRNDESKAANVRNADLAPVEVPVHREPRRREGDEDGATEEHGDFRGAPDQAQEGSKRAHFGSSS